MSKFIVCTTINPPTEAIRRYDALPGWTLIVVGDRKTPPDYRLEDGEYLSVEDQRKLAPALSEAIGWDCIQRRNLGLVLAARSGATVVATVDDDNIPLDGWGEDLLIGREVEVTEYDTDLPAFDPVGATNYPHLWHRGFPLELLPDRDYARKRTARVRPDVQAGFWNGDPDIDAICRMEHRPDCTFDDTVFPLTSTKPGPFNSQNTILDAALLPDYFLFPEVGRMDDIWASYYVQSLGHRVVYERATVFQARNVHDLVTDMKAEYIGYERSLSLVKDLAHDPNSILSYLPQRAIAAWEEFRRALGRS